MNTPNIPKVLERFYVVFTLLYLARGVFPVESSQGDVSHWTEFNAVSFSTQVLLFAILGLLIFVRWDTIVDALRVSRSGSFWPMALCAMAIASTVWSDEPLFTFRRALLLTATTAFAVYLGACFDPDEQLDLFGWMAVVSVLGSFLMAGLFPRYGLSHDLHAGDWKGLFPHKNGLGLQMAFAITVLFIGRPKSLPKWLMATSGLGAAILLVLSHSATSLALTVLILGMYAASHIFRIRRRRTLPLWVALAPLALTFLLGVAIERDAFLDLLSRDATFTGRTQLWSAVVATDMRFSGDGARAETRMTLSTRFDGQALSRLTTDIWICALILDSQDCCYSFAVSAQPSAVPQDDSAANMGEPRNGPSCF
jgi:exopolysaccharide production protein ExoQ